jgi:hypothetical protein
METVPVDKELIKRLIENTETLIALIEDDYYPTFTIDIVKECLLALKKEGEKDG